MTASVKMDVDSNYCSCQSIPRTVRNIKATHRDGLSFGVLFQLDRTSNGTRADIRESEGVLSCPSYIFNKP